MTSRFGVDPVGSVEVYFDPDLGWALRAFAAANREMAPGSHVTIALDPSVGTAALLTVPAVLESEGLTAAGEWQVDDESATCWINVRPDNGVQLTPDQAAVDSILEAEARWERRGIGTQTPRR